MTGLMIKLIICPIMLIVSNYLFDLQLTIIQGSIVGVTLAVFLHIIESIILNKNRIWINTIGDFITTGILVYLSQFIFRNTSIDAIKASLTAAFLTVTEYFQHIFHMETANAKKPED